MQFEQMFGIIISEILIREVIVVNEELDELLARLDDKELMRFLCYLQSLTGESTAPPPSGPR